MILDGKKDNAVNDRVNGRTRNNGAKLIIKHFNTSVAQHFHPIKIATTCNAIPSEVVSSRTVNSFKNSLDKHWVENTPNVRVNWQQSSMPCTMQVCTNSRRPAFCWKWTQLSVLLLLLLLLLPLLLHPCNTLMLHTPQFSHTTSVTQQRPLHIISTH